MRPAKSNRILHCVLAILTVATLTTPVTAQPFGDRHPPVGEVGADDPGAVAGGQ